MHKRRIPSRACIRPPPVYWRRSPFALALLSEAMTAAVATSARAWEAFWSFAFAHALTLTLTILLCLLMDVLSLSSRELFTRRADCHY